jgi:hypothetical protein
MRSVDIELGGKTYTVRELPSRKSKAWRESLETPLRALLSETTDLLNARLSTDAVLPLLGSATDAALGSIDTIFELLCGYAPEVEKDAERVLDEAYDSEIVDAFKEVLGLAYPFGRMASMVKGLIQLGSRQPATGQS